MKKALGSKFIAEAFQRKKKIYMLLHNHSKSTKKKLSISYHNLYWYKKNEDKFEEMTLSL